MSCKNKKLEEMSLPELRAEIDSLDLQLRELLMRRMDCSLQVAREKAESGELRVYREEREREMLSRLGGNIPAGRKRAYLAVLRKITQCSRMYQYALLCNWGKISFSALLEEIGAEKASTRVCVTFIRSASPEALGELLGTVGDYGYCVEKLELKKMEAEGENVCIFLTILGNIQETNMQTLLLQIAAESNHFKILETA